MNRNILKQSFAFFLSLAYVGQITAGVVNREDLKSPAYGARVLNTAFQNFNEKHDEAKIFKDLNEKGFAVSKDTQKLLINEIDGPAPSVTWNGKQIVMEFKGATPKDSKTFTIEVKGTAEKPVALINGIAFEHIKTQTAAQFQAEMVAKLAPKKTASNFMNLMNSIFPMAQADTEDSGTDPSFLHKYGGLIMIGAGVLTAIFGTKLGLSQTASIALGVGIAGAGAVVQYMNNKDPSNDIKEDVKKHL